MQGDYWNNDFNGDASGADPGTQGPAAAPAPAGDPWTPEELAQSQQWANQYYSSHQIPGSYGTPDDIANSYVEKRRGGMNHADAMAYLQTVPGLLGWDKYVPPGGAPAPAAAPAPAPGPAAGADGGGTVKPGPTLDPGVVTTTKESPGLQAGDPSATFVPPAQATGLPSWLPAAPAAPNLPDLPTFAKATPYAEPDYEAALKDPGYQAEVSEGRKAMEQSAAARGVLNGGGTLKDINQWGVNMAAQKVNDVRDRSVNNYLLNYQTQYVDPYKYAYQKALDTFTGASNLWQGNNSIWQTQAQVAQRAGEDQFQQAYMPFNDLWNRRITVGMA